MPRVLSRVRILGAATLGLTFSEAPTGQRSLVHDLDEHFSGGPYQLIVCHFFIGTTLHGVNHMPRMYFLASSGFCSPPSNSTSLSSAEWGCSLASNSGDLRFPALNVHVDLVTIDLILPIDAAKRTGRASDRRPSSRAELPCVRS
jgi:hypothetical protein